MVEIPTPVLVQKLPREGVDFLSQWDTFLVSKKTPRHDAARNLILLSVRELGQNPRFHAGVGDDGYLQIMHYFWICFGLGLAGRGVRFLFRMGAPSIFHASAGLAF